MRRTRVPFLSNLLSIRRLFLLAHEDFVSQYLVHLGKIRPRDPSSGQIHQGFFAQMSWKARYVVSNPDEKMQEARSAHYLFQIIR